MTRKQLVRKIASLLEPRTFKVRIGPCNYIWITAEWCSDIHPEITKVEPKDWAESILIEDLPADGLFALNLSKLKEFDEEIMAACAESDRQAKTKAEAAEYFDNILEEAEAINAA